MPDLFQIHPSCEDPTEKVWKEETLLDLKDNWTNLLSITFREVQTDVWTRKRVKT